MAVFLQRHHQQCWRLRLRQKVLSHDTREAKVAEREKKDSVSASCSVCTHSWSRQASAFFCQHRNTGWKRPHCQRGLQGFLSLSSSPWLLVVKLDVLTVAFEQHDRPTSRNEGLETLSQTSNGDEIVQNTVGFCHLHIPCAGLDATLERLLQSPYWSQLCICSRF